MKNQYVAEKISAKGKAESERLTTLEQDRLTQLRSDNLQAEIQKIKSKRELKGDKLVYKNDDEFKQAGLEILKRYEATEAEKQWFLCVVDSKK